MAPFTVSTPRQPRHLDSIPSADWWESTRPRRTLSLLAGLWLLSGIDLFMSVSAWRNGLLDSGSECNPFAVLVMPFGPWALLVYKIVLTAAGSVSLVVHRRHRIAELAAVVVVLLYAWVVFEWKLFYNICVQSRDVSLGVGDFCDSVDRIGYVTTGCVVAVVAFWGALTRRSDGPTAGPIPTVRRRTVVNLHWAAVMTMVICLLPLCCSPTRSEPRHTGGNVQGTIYFREWLDPNAPLWRMNADGSGKTALPAGVRGKPSRTLHASYRWFLDIREIAGATYPDGGQRRELFAVRSDGLTVQLTEQADLEPSPVTPCWCPQTGDRRISWVARRWDRAGHVVEGGIYAGTVVFDNDGHVLRLARQPGDPLVRIELVDVHDARAAKKTRVPDIRTHDWSPDGAAIVYDSTQSGLFITGLRPHRTTCLMTGPAMDPVWSPDGMRIAFKIIDAPGVIATICPDGTDTRILPGARPGEIVGVARPVWSPGGGHLLHQRIRFPRALELPADVDLFLASADGSSSANLTGDVDTALVPIAWR